MVGVEADYPPYAMEDDRGRPAGFSVDLARAVAEAMDLAVEIRMGPWDEIRRALERREIDAVAGMFYSPERDRRLDFTPPYAVVHQGVFARRGTPPVDDAAGLRGRTLVVMRGDIMHDYVRAGNLSDRVIAVESTAEALRVLARGRGDYALLARLPGLYWIRHLGLDNLREAGPSIQARDYCFAVPEGEALLLGHFVEGLAVVKATSLYREIHDRWLGVLEPRPVSLQKVLFYAVVGAAPLLAVVLAVLVWNRTLRRRVAERTAGLRREIAERQAAEWALQRSEERFRLLVEQASDAFFLFDAGGRFVMVNQRACDVLGYEREALLGMSVDTVDTEFTAERVRDVLAPLGPGEHLRVAGTHRRRDGSTFPVEVTVSCFENNGRRLYLGLARDMTEARRAAAERERLIAELQQSLAEVRTLRGLIPICSHCKKIRDDRGYWNKIESFIARHSEASFSHSICPDCADRHYPGLNLYEDDLSSPA